MHPRIDFPEAEFSQTARPHTVGLKWMQCGDRREGTINLMSISLHRMRCRLLW